jgi:uncharacterized protein YjbI with pentapeptide repeats
MGLLPVTSINGAPPKLTGKTFAFTGRSVLKTSIHGWIKREGGRLQSRLTGRVDYLLVGKKRGNGPTAEERQAAQLKQRGAHIEIIAEEDFGKLLSPTREEAIALLTAGEKESWRWHELRRRRGIVIPLPDLAGADLRGLAGWRLNFEDVSLDQADMRKVELRSVEGLKVAGAQLDGAWLCHSRIVALRCCSLRGADLSDSGCDDMEGSDFTGATMTEFGMPERGGRRAVFCNARMSQCCAPNSDVSQSDFSGADLTKANFEGARMTKAKFVGACLVDSLLLEADLRGADLTKADLSRAELSSARLQGARLVAARLQDAILIGADLRDADLSKADFRGANLCDADLTGATIDGANFKGTQLVGARLGGLDATRARGLAEALRRSAERAGPRLQELMAVARNTDAVNLSIKLEKADVVPVYQMSVWCGKKGAGGRFEHLTGEESPDKDLVRAATTAGVFMEMARRAGPIALILDSLVVTVENGPITPTGLRPIIVAALAEVFGTAVPSDEEQEKARNQFRAELRTALRHGKRKQYYTARLEKAGHFRKADLSGIDLSGVDLEDLDCTGACFDRASLHDARSGRGFPFSTIQGVTFEGSSFCDADLSGAYFGHARCRGANFRGARLESAFFNDADLRGATFHNANLKGAHLPGADLRGADLSTAKLKNASLWHALFDGFTKFPSGFRIPDEMKWKGKGPRSARRN